MQEETRKIDLDAFRRKIKFEPNPWQARILSKLKRFTKIVGGKRGGKSYLSSYLSFRELISSNREIWVVAPTYELASRVWSNVEPWARKFPNSLKVVKQDPFIGRAIDNKFRGSTLRIKSADNPKQLKGEAGDLLVVEEAGDIDDEVWPKYLEPFISEKRKALGGEKGRAIFIGNAAFRGSWFHRLWEMEEDEENASFWIPTAIEDKEGNIIGSSNPDFLDIEELKRIKKHAPERDWRQQWLAEWLAESGEVFKNVELCAVGKLREPIRGDFYYIGIDLGRLQDFTVITVLNSRTGNVDYWDRFKDIEYPYQKKKILSVADRFGRVNSKLLIDQTGLGQPIVDDLVREGLNVEGFVFTNESKKDIVEKLALMLEQLKITYPNEPAIIEELKNFSYRRSEKTNRIIYFAPSGYHDDSVMSLALAVKELQVIGRAEKNLTKDEVFKEGKEKKTKQLFLREERPKTFIRPLI